MTCFGFASGNPGMLLILYIEFEVRVVFSSCLAGWYTSQEIYVMIPDHGQNLIGFEDGQDTQNISNLKLIFQSVLVVIMGNRPVSLNRIWTNNQKLAGIHYHAKFGDIIFSYAPRMTVGNQQNLCFIFTKKNSRVHDLVLTEIVFIQVMSNARKGVSNHLQLELVQVNNRETSHTAPHYWPYIHIYRCYVLAFILIHRHNDSLFWVHRYIE